MRLCVWRCVFVEVHGTGVLCDCVWEWRCTCVLWLGECTCSLNIHEHRSLDTIPLRGCECVCVRGGVAREIVRCLEIGG